MKKAIIALSIIAIITISNIQTINGYIDGDKNGQDDRVDYCLTYFGQNFTWYDDLGMCHWNQEKLIPVPYGQSLDNQAQALTTVDTTEFSMSVPNNWAYTRGIYSHVGLTPNEFGEFLVDAFRGDMEELKYGGAYAEFRYSWYYPIQNAPFNAFVKYELDTNFHGFKLTSKQNATIDNEPAVKIYADGIKEYYTDTNYTDIKSILYLAWHDEKPYRIQYTASAKDFEKYLPQFEQMVKAFRFVT